MNKFLSELNTVPNYISILRLFLAVPVIYLMDRIPIDDSFRYYSAGLMLFAAFTDMLDGFFARKLNQITEAGKIIDPFADKLLVILIVVKLFLINEIDPLIFWIIVLRDILIFLGGMVVSKIIGKVLPSNLLGKISVMIIGTYLFSVVLGVKEFVSLHNVLYVITIVFCFASLIGYTIRGVESVRWHKNEVI